MSKVMNKATVCVPDVSELLPVREYKCKYGCGKAYKNRMPYDSHLQKMHGFVNKDIYQYYQCPDEGCVYRGDGLYKVRKHYQTCHIEKRFKCTHCGRAFLMKSQLSRHRCGYRQYTCPTCPITFKSLCLRNRHVHLCFRKRMRQMNETREKTLGNDKENQSRIAANGKIVEMHLKRNAEEKEKHSKCNDDITLEEIQQLMHNIENNIVTDTALINELAKLTPVLLLLQSGT